MAETRAELSRPVREQTRTMNTFTPAELKWDPALILPKSPYPPKSASYTVSVKGAVLFVDNEALLEWPWKHLNKPHITLYSTV